MRDGRTQRLQNTESEAPREGFLKKHRATLVIVSGSQAGSEFELGKDRVLLGRGPSVDIEIEDPTMSRQHVAFDITHAGFRVRDLGSTNGILMNGSRVDAAPLRHGDRVQVGNHVFQYLLESIEPEPRTYVVSD